MTPNNAANGPLYDIAVIGLGPAGATLARLLEPRFTVLALDRKSEEAEGGFRKACGGLLAPDAQKALARFDLSLPLKVMVDPQIFSVKTIDVSSGIARNYQRHYVNLDRHAFDRWLISLLPESITIRKEATCTAVERIPAGFRITWREKDGLKSACAKYVVGADGAASFVRKSLYPEFTIRRYTAIQQWFSNKHPSPFYSCVFDPRITDCYAWGLTKNEYFLFGGAFEPKHARRKFDALKEKIRSFGFVLDEPLKTEACVVLRPERAGDVCTGDHGAFFVGEAAGFISPSSLEGISYAFDSARKLAEILNKGAKEPNAAYCRATWPLRLKLLAKIWKCPFIFSPLLRKLVMLSGLKSVAVWPQRSENSTRR